MVARKLLVIVVNKMINRFIILDRPGAVRYCYKKHEDKSIIVSINSSNSKAAHLTKTKKNGIIAVLPLWFDDITHSIDGYVLFDDSMARNIIQFVNTWKDEADTFVVHCDAGISRSAAVCAAIRRYLGFEDMSIFDNYMYNPNPLVYYTMMEQIKDEYDPKEDDEKFSINSEYWE